MLYRYTGTDESKIVPLLTEELHHIVAGTAVAMQ
jgi:hypothetical protein